MTITTPQISASILSADFARLGEEVQAVIASGADMIHIDVMDHHFVPNLTIGPLVCQSLRSAGIDAIFDVHLMVTAVDTIIPAFAKAGATIISFHPQTTPDVNHTIDIIHHHGCKAGLVLNPKTPPTIIEPFLNQLDLIVVMAVKPGAAGQTFIPSTLTTIKATKTIIGRHKISLSVDGGIKLTNITKIIAAGADILVAGSTIFNSDDYASTIAQMKALASK